MGYSHKNSKGVTYFLHSCVTQLRGGKDQKIYYFAKTVMTITPKGKVAEHIDLPATYKVMENPRNGFLTLKRTDR
jgi:hypothetical protein